MGFAWTRAAPLPPPRHLPPPPTAGPGAQPPPRPRARRRRRCSSTSRGGRSGAPVAELGSHGAPVFSDAVWHALTVAVPARRRPRGGSPADDADRARTFHVPGRALRGHLLPRLGGFDRSSELRPPQGG